MIVITGGAFQGKTAFIENRFPEHLKAVADGIKCTFEEMKTADCIAHYHRYIKRRLEEGADEEILKDEAVKLASCNPHVIIELDEVGSGIVPMEAEERRYRETVGRVGCVLAAQAEEVYRVICGIGVKLK